MAWKDGERCEVVQKNGERCPKFAGFFASKKLVDRQGRERRICLLHAAHARRPGAKAPTFVEREPAHAG
jgi:hypothetical protein